MPVINNDGDKTYKRTAQMQIFHNKYSYLQPKYFLVFQRLVVNSSRLHIVTFSAFGRKLFAFISLWKASSKWTGLYCVPPSDSAVFKNFSR